MTYEAIPQNIVDDPDLMRQFVLGQLPASGGFPGRIVTDAQTNIADLVGWVEGGYLSVETINRVMSDSPAVRAGANLAPLPLHAHDIGMAVSRALQDRHAALSASAGAAQLEADGVGVAWVLGGIDDVPAAVEALGAEVWVLNGDELYVTGASCEQIAEALASTRPAPQG